MGHSKLPFKLAACLAEIVIIDRDEKVVCNLTVNLPSADIKLAADRAVEIVTACNEYPKLKRDNEAMVELLEELRGQGFMETCDYYQDRIDEITALAKGE